MEFLDLDFFDFWVDAGISPTPGCSASSPTIPQSFATCGVQNFNTNAWRSSLSVQFDDLEILTFLEDEPVHNLYAWLKLLRFLRGT